jgi:serine/threonine protein phosphatase PrpC
MVTVEQTNSISQAPAEGSRPAGASVTSFAMTHVGSWRGQNEDAYCVETSVHADASSRHLLAVADGLGGHGHGDIAARTAIDAAKAEFQKWRGGSPEHFISGAVRRANEEVFTAAQGQAEWAGMQTTLTAVAVEGDTLAVGHVGDTRLYRVANNIVEVLTRDHSMANDLLRLHLIRPDQVQQHPERHRLTRTVGSSPFLHADIQRIKITPGDAFVLCSDGFWSEVSPENIRDMVKKYEPEKACRELLSLALNSAAPDNITAIVFRIESVGRNSASSWKRFFKRGN